MLPVSRPCQPIGCRTRSDGSVSPAPRPSLSPPSSRRLPTVGSARRKSSTAKEHAFERILLGAAAKSGDPAALPAWRPRVNGLGSLAARQGSRFAGTCLRFRERGPIRSLGPLVPAALKVRPVVAIPMRAGGTRLGPSREREGKRCLRVAALEPLVLAAFGRFTRGSEGASKCVGKRDQSRERGRRSSERRAE